MSNINKDRSSWDSDDELLEETTSFTFDKDLDKYNEDELLACSDSELFDEDRDASMNWHTNSPQSAKSILDNQSEESLGEDDSRRRLHMETPFQGDMKTQNEDGDRGELANSNMMNYDGGGGDDNIICMSSELENDQEFKVDFQHYDNFESEMDILGEDNEKEEVKMKDYDDDEELDYEEDEEDEDSRTRDRFKSERKQLNLPAVKKDLSGIPDTLELSKEDEKKIEEFVQQKGRKNRNNRNNYQQQRMNHQNFNMQQHKQLSDQRGLLGHPQGLLRGPPPMNMHFMQQRFHGVNNSGGLAHSLANAAVNLMMMDGAMQFRNRSHNLVLPPMNSIRHQHSTKMLPHHQMPINRFQNADIRLRAPCTLQTQNPSTASFGNGQTKIDMTGPGNFQQQYQTRLMSHPRTGQQPVVNPSRDISEMQVTRPVRPRSTMPPPHGLPLSIAERPLSNNHPIQVITHHQGPSHLQPGLFAAPGQLPPINLNVPPPRQLPPRFIQQPIRVVLPVNQPAIPFSVGGFPPFGGNASHMHHQGHLQVVRGNFQQSGNNMSHMMVSSSTGKRPAPPELIGRPIETVVLRQSGNKNKPAGRPNNVPPNNNVSVKQQSIEELKNRLELEEANKKAKRAERFSKPSHVLPKVVDSCRVEQEISNEVSGKMKQKRSGSPGSSIDENPSKLLRTTSNRRVIARIDSQEIQHRNVLASDDAVVSLSGDGDYKDFELMKGLERQKRMRELILKRKEESRQLLVQQKRKNTEFTPSNEMLKDDDPFKIITPSLLPSSSNAEQGSYAVKAATGDSKDKKPMKKVLMTKSQYKALVQHMKSKGIPLPKAIKEVSAKSTGSTNGVPNLSGNADISAIISKTRRVVQMSDPPLLVPPQLSVMPTLLVPDVMPIPPALALHPRFSGSNLGVLGSTVLVSGLSASTKYTQLKSLAEKIGPIQSLRMLLNERKAELKFHNPHHALTFASRYNGSTIEYSVVSAVVSER